MRLLILAAVLHLLVPHFCVAQEAAAPDSAAATPRAAVNDKTQVAILGYHEFSETREPNQMLIRTDDFRSQMQRLKDANVTVISMDDFLQWKSGQKVLPEHCVMITVDDGWLSTYTDAFPVMKEFGFPFTVFLYTQYLDSGGGRALTSAQVKEMMAGGGTVGSHSITHPLPSAIKKNRAKGPEVFNAYLDAEMGRSAETLRRKFGTAIDTYAYPGGFHTEEMFPKGEEVGYKAMFTVIPGKVRIDSPDHQLNRYIVFGTDSKRFDQAIKFLGVNSEGSLASAANVKLPIEVAPRPGQLIPDRLPNIVADFSSIPTIDPDSIRITVGGLGTIAHIWDAEKMRAIAKVTRRLRHDTCKASVSYRLKGKDNRESPVEWTFGVELEAAYQPRQQP